MKNPLWKRLPKELAADLGKYLVIFLFMVFSIGFVSGFLVAGESMVATYDESFEKYHIENGNFEYKEAVRNIGERKNPLFRVSGLSGGS